MLPTRVICVAPADAHARRYFVVLCNKSYTAYGGIICLLRRTCTQCNTLE